MNYHPWDLTTTSATTTASGYVVTASWTTGIDRARAPRKPKPTPIDWNAYHGFTDPTPAHRVVQMAQIIRWERYHGFDPSPERVRVTEHAREALLLPYRPRVNPSPRVDVAMRDPRVGAADVVAPR